MASELPLVAVCGATGAQGGNVVRGLLAAGNVRIRGLTRNVESEKAQALTAQGVEMVSADFTDVDSLRAAFAGANRVFILTNSFDPTAMGNEDGEIPLIKNIGEALRDGGVEYCVHSIFEDTRPLLEDRPSVQGTWKVPHFDRKNVGNQYLREEVGLKVYTVNTGFYYENLFSPMAGLTNEDGVLTLAEPTSTEDKPFCLVSVADIGLAAARLLADPGLGMRVAGEFNGGSEDFGLRPEWLSTAEVGAILNEIFEEEVRGVGQDYDVYAAAMPFMGTEIANMFWFYCERRADMLPDMSMHLLEQPKSLRDWVAENAQGIRDGWHAKLAPAAE